MIIATSPLSPFPPLSLLPFSSKKQTKNKNKQTKKKQKQTNKQKKNKTKQKKTWLVIMTHIKLNIIWERKHPLGAIPQLLRRTIGEITTGSTRIRHEESVSSKQTVVFEVVGDAIGGVSWGPDGLRWKRKEKRERKKKKKGMSFTGKKKKKKKKEKKKKEKKKSLSPPSLPPFFTNLTTQISNLKHLSILPKMIKLRPISSKISTELRKKSLLYLTNPLSNTHFGSSFLFQICRRSNVVGMGMGFQNVFTLHSLGG